MRTPGATGFAGQLLIGRRYLWLPRWLLERLVARGKVDTALS